VIHDVCLQKLPVVFAMDRGGFVGEDGPTHHGMFDFSFMRAVPNLIVMAPKDENELQHMLKTAVECGMPVSLRYPRGAGVGVKLDETPRALPTGQGEVVFDPGEATLAIVAIGNCVHPSIEAARILQREGTAAIVINARFVKPIDEELLLETAKKIKKFITVEENALMGGFGSAVLELLADKGVDWVSVTRIGLPDTFAPQGTQKELRRLYGIDAEGIAATARKGNEKNPQRPSR
jgi:1-deoxy-D-xylulose-5-phosphate synthase